MTLDLAGLQFTVDHAQVIHLVPSLSSPGGWRLSADHVQWRSAVRRLIGRTGLPGGDMNEMVASLARWCRIDG